MLPKSTDSTATPAPQSAVQPAPAPQLEAPQEAAPTELKSEPAKPKQDDDLAHRFAILSRKQKAIFEKERELKEKERRIAEIEERERLFDKDPLEYISKRGKSLDDILKHAAGEDKTPESRVEALERKIAEYEARIREDEERKERENQELEYQTRVDEFKKQIKLDIGADTARWEAINETESHDAVYEVVRQYYETHGEIPPVEWAADQVENELIEQAKKFARLKKIAPAQALEAAAGALKTDPKEQKTPVPTLTNKLAPEPQVNNDKRFLSDEESRAEAAKMLRWNG